MPGPDNNPGAAGWRGNKPGAAGGREVTGAGRRRRGISDGESQFSLSVVGCR